MKILIVIDSLGSGGAQRLKTHLAKGLKKRNYDVEFFIYDSNHMFFQPELVNAGIKINLCERKSKGFSITVIKELRKLIKKNNYDVVISSLHVPSIYASFAKLGINRTKLIVCEESSSIAPVPFLKKYLFYIATLITDNLVTNSHHEANLIKNLPGRSDKTKVIWNGFDLSKFDKSRHKKQNKNDINKLLIVGRVAYPKNGMNLLKGLYLFEKRNGWMPEVNWVGRKDTDIRSTKDTKSSSMIQEMDDFLIKNRSLARKWNWRGTVKDVQEFYDSSDALLSVSIYEGMPMVIGEAMLSGCFVIASNICDNPLIIGKNERGLLCEPYDPLSICEALETLCQMEAEKKEKIITSAKEFATKKLDYNRMVDEYELLFMK